MINGAPTLIIMTHSLTTFIKMTLSIIVNKMQHSAYWHSAQGRSLLCGVSIMVSVISKHFCAECRYAECHYAEHHSAWLIAISLHWPPFLINDKLKNTLLNCNQAHLWLHTLLKSLILSWKHRSLKKFRKLSSSCFFHILLSCSFKCDKMKYYN